MTGKDLYKIVLSLLFEFNAYPGIREKYLLPIARMLYPEALTERVKLLLEMSKRTHLLQWLSEQVFLDMKPLRTILNDLAQAAKITMSFTKPATVPLTQMYVVDPSMFNNQVVQTATVTDEPSAFHLESVRDLEVAVAQDEYDLEQLKYRGLK